MEEQECSQKKHSFHQSSQNSPQKCALRMRCAGTVLGEMQYCTAPWPLCPVQLHRHPVLYCTVHWCVVVSHGVALFSEHSFAPFALPVRDDKTSLLHRVSLKMMCQGARVGV